MRTETRNKFNQYLAQQAKLNHIGSAAQKFNVEPTIQQRLETAMQESSAFLSRINMLGVTEQSGASVMLGVGSTIASRTDTTKARRNTRDVASLSSDDYTCKKTDYDTHVTYALLDAWAKFPDFQARLSNAIVQRQALDRIMVGWHGTQAAADTDREKNPLLQDVNIGWLQKYRSKASDRVLDSGDKKSGNILLGDGGDYANLDALVYDAVQMLDPWYRKSPDLVAIIDRNLIHSKMLAAIERGAASNREELAADEIITRTHIGGLPYVDVPHFPDGVVMVTSLKNLSIYWQEGARRRLIREEPEWDRIATYESSNDAYVIEDFGLCAVVENIQRMDQLDDNGEASAGEEATEQGA